MWIGLTGEDARPLLSLDSFYGSYSLADPLESDNVEVCCIESFSKTRHADWDEQSLAAAGRWILGRLVDACSKPSIVVPFSRFPFLSTISTERQVRCLIPSRAASRFLNSKPLVESALAAETDVRLIPWFLVPRGEQRLDFIESRLRNGPIVLRISPSAGGHGHEVIHEKSQLASSRLLKTDGAVMAAPYLTDHIPVNIGGCVFPDGGVTLHTPSVQLIGIPGCTRFDLGYCGNDFAAIKQLSDSAIVVLESMALEVGKWLHSRDYVGAFGIDALVAGDDVTFVEVNPRFQSSTRLSAQLDAAVDAPDIMLDHLMAYLGVASYKSPPLREIVSRTLDRANLLCYNLTDAPLRRSSPASLRLPGVRAASLPAAGVAVRPNSKLVSLEFDASVTVDGRSLVTAAQNAYDRAGRAWSQEY